MKEAKKTITDIAKELQVIQQHIYDECDKCNGTGALNAVHKCKECGGAGTNVSRITQIESKLVSLKQDVQKIALDLKAYMNRQTAEIRVLPKGHNPSLQGGNSKIKSENGWEDYTGVFFIDPEDEKKIVLEKAREHFKTYFEDAVYHRNKRLGVFLSGARSGKQLVEEMATDD